MVLFIYKPNLHEGLIGIIASRIKDYFNKPCIVLTNSNNILKGSARSTSDFNIGEYIQKSCNKILLMVVVTILLLVYFKKKIKYFKNL
jgi:single-stranded-DNA-specific exonuclease